MPKEIPQIGWFKTMEMYFLTVLKVRCLTCLTGLNQFHRATLPLEVPGEGLFFASGFWSLLALPWLVSHIISISASITFSYMCLSNLPLLLRLIVMEFKIYRDHPGRSHHFKTFYLMTNAKTLFANKILFVGSRD